MGVGEADLDKCAVIKPGHRKRLLKGVATLNENEVPDACTTPPPTQPCHPRASESTRDKMGGESDPF